MFHKARKDGKIPLDVMPGEFTQKRLTNPRRSITPDEYKSLLNVAPPDYRDLFICAYESGMRSSEIAGLTPSQVRIDQETISDGKRAVVSVIDLGIFDTKTRTHRTVPISSNLKEVLKRRIKSLGPEDKVFT